MLKIFDRLFYVLIAMVAAFAVAAFALAWNNSETNKSIEQASRFEKATLCVNGKAEAYSLSRDLALYSAIPTAANLETVHHANEIVQGRLLMYSRGEFGAMVQMDQAVQRIVSTLNAKSSVFDQQILRLKDVGASQKISTEVADVLPQFEMLCSATAAHGAIEINQFQEKLRRQNRISLIMMASLLASGVALIVLLGFQNRMTHQAYERQRVVSQEFEFLATHDSLTGLTNRAKFRDLINDMTVQAKQSATEVALISFDLDRFKLVNDMLGHPAGDKILESVAARLESLAANRNSLFFARTGGDEFSAIVAQPANSENAQMVTDQIITALGAPFNIDGHHVVVEASAGLSILPRHVDSMRELIRTSDVALNQAKKAGKARAMAYTPYMDEELKNRQALEIEMLDALRAGHFVMNYQPYFDLRTNKMMGVEALVRWHHPTKGIISPMTFIPIAEENGMIVELGRFVLEQSCKDAMLLPSHLKMAVNLSAAQFARDDVAELVRETLHQTGFPPNRLELEVTESLLIHDSRKVAETLNHIQEHGIAIALDDFGTGYSSLSYLRRFPFQKLKIDRSFVKDIGHDLQNLKIVQTIASLAKTLDMVVTAEGVETVEQAEIVKAIGCTYAQGYYFARPMALAQLREQFQTPQRRVSAA